MNIDVNKMIEAWNDWVENEKPGLKLILPEAINSEVEIECFFDRLGNNKKHACVYNITNENSDYTYASDLNKKGEPINHIWLENVADDYKNPNQAKLWQGLNRGDHLKIKGKLTTYGKHNKLSLSSAKIVEINN